jgi:hypothetical protein
MLLIVWAMLTKILVVYSTENTEFPPNNLGAKSSELQDYHTK